MKLNDILNGFKISKEPIPIEFPSGIEKLDENVVINRGSMLIVAARPSNGKSQFAFNNIAVNSAQNKKTVHYYSLEDSKELITRRYIAMKTGVNSRNIRHGTINETEAERIAIYLAEHDDLPIELFVDIGYNPDQIELNIEQCGVPDMIIIDYVNKANTGGQDEYKAITEYSHRCPLIARKYNCAMVLCCQVGRMAQGEGNSQTIHPPQLHHLRNSGALEQDANAVLMLHYKYMYSQNQDDRNNIQIRIAKNKEGEVGNIDCTIIPEYNKITNLIEGRIY